MNDLDLLVMSVEELQPELSIWPSMGKRAVARRVKLARALLKVRKDVQVHYLAGPNQGFVGPCLCVRGSGPYNFCRVCRRLDE